MQRLTRLGGGGGGSITFWPDTDNTPCDSGNTKTETGAITEGSRRCWGGDSGRGNAGGRSARGESESQGLLRPHPAAQETEPRLGGGRGPCSPAVKTGHDKRNRVLALGNGKRGDRRDEEEEKERQSGL